MSVQQDEQPPCDWDKLGFALTTTDTMYIAQLQEGDSWAPGELQPYGDIKMSPAAGVLNYGQGIFEGMKAQRTDAGDIVIFRPNCNSDRFAASAARLGMPTVPEDMFVDAVQSVVAANARWVPPTGKGALYIRPCLWGSGGILGVAPAPQFTFCIYACPVGPYFKGGMSPIALQVSDEHHRAAPGGQGGAKAIGNYAPGMVPCMKAKKQGFNEILYLDAVEHRYVEEAGAANFFCVKNGVVHTPALVGTILPGITRMSVIQIAKDLGHEVREERVDISFALEADECFCTGTAAVIAPIGRIQHGDRDVTFAGGEVGPLTRKLYDMLTGIQVGKVEDKHDWVRKVQVPNNKA